MTKVCRLCLNTLQRGSKYFNVNAVESFTGFMPYRDQLTTCIPEMALDLIPNPVICNGCRIALKTAYDFKNRCLQVEEKIRQHVHSDSAKQYLDLTAITRDSSKSEKNSLEHNESNMDEEDDDVDDDMMEDDHHLPDDGEEEIDLADLSKLKKLQKIEVLTEEAPVKNNESSLLKMLNSKPPRRFTCPAMTCLMEFDDINELLAHKSFHTRNKKSVGEDYQCNFCGVTYRSLQLLRRHNTMCSKNQKPVEQVNTILTKRPHLPAKAKNHLKKWLFKHTEHPYPTDLEKQQLMEETNLTLVQVENWFINARRRILSDLTRLKYTRKKRPLSQHTADYFDNPDFDLDKLQSTQRLEMAIMAVNNKRSMTVEPVNRQPVKSTYPASFHSNQVDIIPTNMVKTDMSNSDLSMSNSDMSSMEMSSMDMSNLDVSISKPNIKQEVLNMKPDLQIIQEVVNIKQEIIEDRVK